MRGRRQRLGPALPVAALLLATASGGGGHPPVGNLACTSDFRVFTQQTVPVPVDGHAQVICPPPGAPPGQGFPPPSSAPIPSGSGIPLGQPCSFVLREPITITPTANGDATVQFQQPPAVAASGVLANPMPLHYFINAGRSTSAAELHSFIMFAGLMDGFMEFPFHGTGQSDGTCGPLNNDANWPLHCWFQVPAGCSMWTSHFIPTGGAGLPPSAISGQALNLAGDLRTHVFPGTMSAMPSQAGVAQTPTCFFLDGVRVDSLDILNNAAWFEMVLVGPPIDASNRHILYIFRIEVTYDGVTWDFGDGDSSQAPLTQPFDGLCAGHQLTVGHVYTHYSPAGQPYRVTATEHFGVHAWEFWNDTTTHAIQLPDSQLPHIAVTMPTGGPLLKTIYQVEGVPVGG